jgi:hypothetical protein
MNSRTPTRQVRKDVAHLTDPKEIAAALHALAQKLQHAAHDAKGQDRINLLAARKLVQHATDLLPTPDED